MTLVKVAWVYSAFRNRTIRLEDLTASRYSNCANTIYVRTVLFPMAYAILVVLVTSFAGTLIQPVRGYLACNIQPCLSPCSYACKATCPRFTPAAMSGTLHRDSITCKEPMKEVIRRVTSVVEQKLLGVMQRVTPEQGFLGSTTANGSMAVSAVSWTAGFVPGIMWQLHSLTENRLWSNNAQLWQGGLANQQKSMWPQHDFGEPLGASSESTCAQQLRLFSQ